jgi:hypothetical protein
MSGPRKYFLVPSSLKYSVHDGSEQGNRQHFGSLMSLNISREYWIFFYFGGFNGT